MFQPSCLCSIAYDTTYISTYTKFDFEAGSIDVISVIFSVGVSFKHRFTGGEAELSSVSMTF